MTKRLAVVSGGIGGLGTEICKYLARSGRRVVAADLGSRAERVAEFKKEVAEFARYLKSTPPSEGSKGEFYPGEVEYLREQERRKNGIEVEDATWEKLRALAGEYKIAKDLDLA